MCRHILISLECPKTGEEWSATSPVVLRSLAPLQLAGPSREILPQKNPRLLQTRVSRAVMNSRLPATAAGDRKEPSRGRASSGDLRDQLPVPTRYFWDYHIELVHTGSCYAGEVDHGWPATDADSQLRRVCHPAAPVNSCPAITDGLV